MIGVVLLSEGLWTYRSAEFTATKRIAGDEVCGYPA